MQTVQLATLVHGSMKCLLCNKDLLAYELLRVHLLFYLYSYKTQYVIVCNTHVTVLLCNLHTYMNNMSYFIIVEIKLIDRQMPEQFVEGEPNLIVCPSGKVLLCLVLYVQLQILFIYSLMWPLCQFSTISTYNNAYGTFAVRLSLLFL